MQLSINDRKSTVATAADLRRHWEVVRGQEYSEVWLNDDDDENSPALCMLVHGEHAWLMWLPDRVGNPPFFTSLNPTYSGPPDAMIDFMLANGQLDEYPAIWALSLEEACAACEDFVETRGGRSLRITWREDR